MMKRAVVAKPWQGKAEQKTRYDAFIGVVGYEKRANYVAAKLAYEATMLFACAFDQRKVFSYDYNLRWFKENHFKIEESSDKDYPRWCRKIIEEVCRGSNPRKRICVDISSISRFRLAVLIATLLEHDGRDQIDVDFLYAPAEFSPPGDEDGPIIIAKPVVETFAGWTTEPSAPPVAILGLGCERDKAVGIVEYIEPGEVWAFRPFGEDLRYDDALKKANRAFWELLPEDHIIEYRVDRPFECLTNLESLIYGTLRSGRPILVPFGPKIFSVCCLLVACIHHPKLAVWRISSGQFEPAVDRLPNGKIIGMAAEFVPFVGVNGT